MADSAVAITAGSGTNIDTRTESTNGQHRQVVVLGDPSTNAGVAPVDATTGLTVSAATVVTALGDKSQFAKVTDGTDTLLVDSHGSAQTTLFDSSGNAVTFNANGQATMANSAPTVLASDMPAIKGYYVAVAASQTDSVIQSSTGATGDFLDYVIVVPATTAAGVVTIKDNSTAIISYVGAGGTALLTLIPFVINVGAFSRSGAWKITTGANVSIVAVGKFS